MSADRPGLPLPPAAYYASLPKIICGAGAIFRDDRDRILLVRPSYRNDTWEIPGGALEPGEDPWRCVQREVKEELGVDLAAGRLLAVDWVPEQPDGRPPLANYLFDAGSIDQEWAERHLHPDGGEVTDWRLATPPEWEQLLAPHLARRLHAVTRALTAGTTTYLHYGYDPTHNPI
jgi:ADP-ribose pyrophosphatase YjhB (NUDIX family)